MMWIGGIAWTGQNYVVETVDKDGVTDTMPVEGLAELQNETGGTRISSLNTDFSTWHLVPPTEYLEAMGFPMDMKTAQDIYQFEIDNNIYQVPASALIVELFYPIKGMARHIFRPHGLENIILTSRLGNPVNYFNTPSAQFGSYRQRIAKRHDALSWMYCFPTARKMWDSVLIKAREGIFSLNLPDGLATLDVTAVEHEKKWFIKKISILEIHTTESTFQFAENSRKTILLRERHQNATTKIYNLTVPPMETPT